MTSLIDDLKKTIEEIRSHSFITIDNVVFQPPIEPERIAVIEELAEINIPENIKQFYLAANGLTCIWRIKEGLDEAALEKIREAEEEPGYDYTKPLGAIRLMSLQDTLVGNYWQPPAANDAGAKNAFPFGEEEYTYASFGKMLKPFDRFYVDNEVQCMAYVIQPGATEFKVMMLDDYYADWQNSRVSDFETYIKLMCATRFTIPSRQRIYGKYRGDKEPLLTFEELDKEEIVPALFRGGAK